MKIFENVRGVRGIWKHGPLSDIQRKKRLENLGKKKWKMWMKYEIQVFLTESVICETPLSYNFCHFYVFIDLYCCLCYPLSNKTEVERQLRILTCVTIFFRSWDFLPLPSQSLPYLTAPTFLLHFQIIFPLSS